VNGSIFEALCISRETCLKHRFQPCASNIVKAYPGKWHVSGCLYGVATIAFQYVELPDGRWSEFRHPDL
jgi:hypothetical protein